MAIGIQTVNAQALGIAKTAIVTPATGKQLHLFAARVHNRSGGALDLGIMKKLSNDAWKLWGIVAADTPDATDRTAAIQTGTATNLATTVDSSGFLIQGKKKFNCLSFNVSTGEVGSPVYTYLYWNGSSYTTLTTITVPTAYTTGEKVILFLIPSDWVVGTDAGTGGDSDKYSIKMVATTAPSTAMKANSLVVGQIIDFTEGVADNGELVWKCPADFPLQLDGGEGLLPYCSASSTANAFSATYAIQD